MMENKPNLVSIRQLVDSPTGGSALLYGNEATGQGSSIRNEAVPVPGDMVSVAATLTMATS